MLLLEALEGGELGAAGWAPRRPKVEEDGLVPDGLRRDGGAGQGEEVDLGEVDLFGAEVDVAAKQEDGGGGEEEDGGDVAGPGPRRGGGGDFGLELGRGGHRRQFSRTAEEWR